MRLALKLTLSFLIVGLACVALIAWLASRRTEHEFQQFVWNQTRTEFVDRLSAFYVSNGSWAGIEAAPAFPMPTPQADERSPRPGGWVTVTDAKGTVLIAGFAQEAGAIVSNPAGSGGTPIEVGGQTVGWVLASQLPIPPSPAEEAFIQRIRSMLLQGAAAAAAISLVLGFLLARTLTRPMRQLTNATRRVAEGLFDQKVVIRSHDELGQLGEAFNRMSAELSRSQALRRQMTADIAHELRTPISIMLGHADAVHDGVLPMSQETIEVIQGEALRLQRLVEDLRTLSLADAGELSIRPEPTMPLALLHRVAGSFAPQAEGRGVRLEVQGPDDLPEILVDPDRMEQVFRNLVANSLHHTPDGGRIILAAAVSSNRVRLSAEDTGRGFAAADLPHVFERFYRTDKSRAREDGGGGSGLGLAIARSIVLAHRGRIWAESLAGHGAIVVIELPAARPLPS